MAPDFPLFVVPCAALGIPDRGHVPPGSDPFGSPSPVRCTGAEPEQDPQHGVRIHNGLYIAPVTDRSAPRGRRAEHERGSPSGMMGGT